MRDITGSVRGIDLPSSREDEDPFAELAEIFESEMGRETFGTGALNPAIPAVQRRDHAGASRPQTKDLAGFSRLPRATFEAAPAVRAPVDFEAEFADALTRDMADLDGRAVRSRRSGDGRRTAASPTRAERGEAAGSRFAEIDPALESELESAIRGLSAPANPRDAIVFETQSFAPERVPDEAPRAIVAPEMDDFDELIASELAAMSVHADSSLAAPMGYQASFVRDDAVAAADVRQAGAAYDELDDEAGFEGARPARGAGRRRFLTLAGGVMSLALVGAAGLYVWKDSGLTIRASASADPILIKADAEPYKVAPKDPGGRAIPNQNKAVYDRVASPAADMVPTQQALLTDAEEPMDLPAEEPPSYKDLPGVEMADSGMTAGIGAEGEEDLGAKNEARIGTADSTAPGDDSSTAVLQPRKVRTMVVRPDGTIVAAQAAAPAASAAPAAAPVIAGAPALIEVSAPASIAGDRSAPENAVGAHRAVSPQSADLLGSAATGSATAERAVTVAAAKPSAKPAQARTTAPAAVVPIPAADPVEAEAVPAPRAADPVEVASIPEPAAEKAAPASLPAGGYFVQISSQPSEALAEKSMHSLSGRFSGVIDGHSVAIQSADIPGKGTYYRVRVAAASKAEASALCTSLKSAGGTCFVTR